MQISHLVIRRQRDYLNARIFKFVLPYSADTAHARWSANATASRQENSLPVQLLSIKLQISSSTFNYGASAAL